MSSRNRRLRSIAVGILALVALAGMPGSALGATSIALQPVVSGFAAPTQITNAHDGTNRLFVVEQRGTIRVIQGGVIQPGFFMDISCRVEDGGERGLLGLAFDPHSRATTGSTFTTHATAVTSSSRGSRRIPPGRRRHREHRPPARADRAQCPDEPQRRRHGVRPERLPVYRHRRRRRRWRPGKQCAEQIRLLGKILRINVNGTGRARSTITPSRGATRSPAPGRVSARSGTYGLRIRGGSRSTAARTSSSSAMSARTGSRRSTGKSPAPRAVGTTAGTRWRACIATPPPSAHSPATRCPTLSTATSTATVRSRAATSIAGRRRRHSSGCTCSPTTAAGGSGRSRITARRSTHPRRCVPTRLYNITSFGESENGELYVVTSAGGVYQVLAS